MFQCAECLRVRSQQARAPCSARNPVTFGVAGRSDIKGTELPPANIMIPLEWEYFVVYKIYNLLSDSANCTVLRAVVLTQYQRVTDGETHGIPIGSKALARRALLRGHAI